MMDTTVEEDVPLTIQSLPTSLLELKIFETLDLKSLAAVASTCREFQVIVQNMIEPFKTICVKDFGIEEPAGRAGSWHGTWLHTVSRSEQLLPLASETVRAGTIWATLKHWLDSNGATAITESLNPPATDEAIAQVEENLGLELPAALKAVYTFHDGQGLQIDRMFDMASGQTGFHPSIFHGLIGGYSAYENLVCTRLLPLSRLLRYTRICRDNKVIPENSGLVVFAASYDFSKIHFIDTMTGQVKVSQADRRQTFPAGPEAPDGFLLWLEEHTRRCVSGAYSVARLIPDMKASVGINLFPQSVEGGMSLQVTKGIVVRASAIFCPEQSLQRGLQPRYHFNYSIRFSLQQPEEQAEASRFDGRTNLQCQLETRHWIMRDEKGIVTGEVRGEGVIGEYPLLVPGEPEYVYQSCTHQSSKKGSMEGDFAFAVQKGHLSGETVDAVCGQFQLALPEFIF